MPVDKSGQRVRRMFGEIAGRYDFLNRLLSLNVDRYWRWRTVREAPPQGAWPVLDVCTGTADLALAYERAAARTAQREANAADSANFTKASSAPVVGADFCHEMLAIGRRKVEKAGVADRVTLVEADAQHLPFDDDTFQLVSVAFGLRNVNDTLAGLREMARVCRPGGRLAVLEFSRPRFRPLRGVYGWYFRHVLPRIGQWLARNRFDAYHYLPESVNEFPDGQDLCRWIEQAGWEAAAFRPLAPLGIATLYMARKPATAKLDDAQGEAVAADAAPGGGKESPVDPLRAESCAAGS